MLPEIHTNKSFTVGNVASLRMETIYPHFNLNENYFDPNCNLLIQPASVTQYQEPEWFFVTTNKTQQKPYVLD